MNRLPLLVVDECGLTCPAGNFTIDPWGPVENAILTHAHADHAQPVMQRALVANPGLIVARDRLEGIEVEGIAYGERRQIGDVTVSLHPSGHILGAAQVRVERDGEVWVVSGDYKLAPDPTCAPFEPVACDVFITEATFGLPLFRWQPTDVIHDDIARWLNTAKTEGHAALIYAYALGKAPRILAELATRIDFAAHGKIYTHGAIERMLNNYRASGVILPDTTCLTDVPAKKRTLAPGSLVVAPPRAQNTPWAKKLDAQDVVTAVASGWMRVRGMKRRKFVERGFALSDHADWPALLQAIEASRASRVLVTHGYATQLARYLKERGLDAQPLATQWEGELDVERPAESDAAP